MSAVSQAMLFGLKPRVVQLVYTDTKLTGTVSGTVNFPSTNIGAENANRYIVVSCAESSNNLTSVTVAGTACTRLLVAVGSRTTSLWITNSAIPTGTAATVSVTVSTTTEVELSVYSLVGAVTPSTLYASISDTSDPTTGTVNVPAGGCIVAVAIGLDTGTYTWTGVTKDTDGAAVNFQGSFASYGAPDDAVALEVGRTITANSTNTEFALVVAVWSP